MKNFFAGLTMLSICGALNFRLMNNARVAKLDETFSEVEFEQMAPPPPPGW